ncbi:MAG: GNAT family N-acetyltransferase [bacterium]|nr:GNAT family N-acetyltransferase [bacterium]
MNYADLFANMAPLEGRIAVLEPVRDGLAIEVLEATIESRPELVRFMPWDCWMIDDAQGFVNGAIEARAKGERLELAVREAASGRFAGMIGLKSLDPFTPQTEVGYWIRTSMAGQGLASDAVRTLLVFCRDDLKLARINAIAADTNAASQRVLAKAGFEKEGFKRRGELCHGVWLDMVLFGIVFE